MDIVAKKIKLYVVFSIWITVLLLLMKKGQNSDAGSFMEYLLGGVKWRQFPIDVYALGRWLITITSFIVINEIRLIRWKQLETYVLYRMKSLKRFWIRSFMESLKFNMICIVLFFLILIIISSEQRINQEIILIYGIHILVITTIQTLGGYVFDGYKYLGIMIGLEAFSPYLLTDAMPGIWGMYFQSEYYVVGGFSVIPVLELEICIVIGSLFLGTLKRKER